MTVLARGGYSTVYRARQDSIGREVALKIDTRSLESDRDRRRFLREAEAAGRMSGHPNVVNVYDAGVTADNHPYLVMELCTGGSYASLLRQQGPLSPAEVRDVGVKIADALQAAHDAGILHRDVKPGNILLNKYGVPGLADFGLAALPDPNRELSVTIEALTPAYAPPEVFRMEQPTPLGDQYALGASLYALLSGRPPRWPESGTPSLATMIQVLDDPVPDIEGIPLNLSAVLRQSMAAYPDDRFPSAGAFRDALASLDLPDSPGTPPRTPTVSPGSTPASAPPFSAPPASAPPFSAPPASGGGWGAAASVSRPVSTGTAYPATTYGPQASQSAHFGQPPPPVGGQTPPPGYPPQQNQYNPYGPPPGVPQRPAPAPKQPVKRLLVILGVAVAVLLVVVGIGAVLIAATNSDNGDGGSPGASTSTSDSPSATSSPSPSPSNPFGGSIPFDLPSSNTNAYGSACQLATAAAGTVDIDARCPASAECWETADGSANGARNSSCTGRHTWETYVIGTLASSTKGADDAAVRSDANVTNVCTQGVLSTLLQTSGISDGTGWNVGVLGPSSGGIGQREFRCVGGKGKDGLDKPVFV